MKERKRERDRERETERERERERERQREREMRNRKREGGGEFMCWNQLLHYQEIVEQIFETKTFIVLILSYCLKKLILRIYREICFWKILEYYIILIDFVVFHVLYIYIKHDRYWQTAFPKKFGLIKLYRKGSRNIFFLLKTSRSIFYNTALVIDTFYVKYCFAL